jgi:uncharacterized metal-binding protein YceD (DUF177 family)
MMPRCSECEAATVETEAPAEDAEPEPATEQKKPNPFAQLLKK